MIKDIIYHKIVQGTPEWHQVRCGKLTASNVANVMSPSALINDGRVKMEAGAVTHARKIIFERITNHKPEVIPTLDMQRGIDLEGCAITMYNQKYQPVSTKVGFIENKKFGFSFGASPDALCEDGKGGVEVKSPQPQHHLATFLDDVIKDEYIVQMQATMLAGDLEYIDFISYCEGLKTRPIRIEKNEDIQSAIIRGGKKFEQMVKTMMQRYNNTNGTHIDLPEVIE